MLPQKAYQYRYVAEILRDGVAPLTTGELHPDWTPAFEWAHLQGIRASDAALRTCAVQARLSPGWDHTAGAPYVSHVDVCFSEPGTPATVIPRGYFTTAVQRAVAQMVADGQLRKGDPYRWRICAYPAAGVIPAAAAEEPFKVQAANNSTPIPQLRLSKLLARAKHRGPRLDDKTDIPVLFAPEVLLEAAAAASAAGTCEAGGILLGRLARDAEAGDLVVQVAAQIPAREAIADDASLRFTADTWKAVQAAIRLRRADEQIVGWWHSHPAALWPCRNCPTERRARCAANRSFFSSMDVAFHRTAFQGAHNIALLLSFLDDPTPGFDLFGWRSGRVCRRDYYITEGRR